MRADGSASLARGVSSKRRTRSNYKRRDASRIMLVGARSAAARLGGLPSLQLVAKSAENLTSALGAPQALYCNQAFRLAWRSLLPTSEAVQAECHQREVLSDADAGAGAERQVGVAASRCAQEPAGIERRGIVEPAHIAMQGVGHDLHQVALGDRRAVERDGARLCRRNSE